VTTVAVGALPWATDRASIDDLLELIEPPAWHRDALCREYPELSWFPGRTDDVRPAKAVCGRCLVAFERRSWAMQQGSDLHGIWAGLSDRERRQMRAITA
jgi:WhiB family transcriptional regulator, redox-sensing transcriptional regulator